jgi:uncharacterized phiE125 gp8 family phage protein
MIVYSRVTTAPTTEPITLDEAKAWLKIDGTDEDTLLTSLITSARIACENYSGLSFITQSRTVKLDRLYGDVILPYGPVTAITSVVYKDPDDDTDVTFTPANYYVDYQSGLAKIRVNDDGWPDTNRTLNNVVITYVAGYANAAAVPEIAKTAIKKRMAKDHSNRGDSNVSADEWMDDLDLIKVYWNAEVC